MTKIYLLNMTFQVEDLKRLHSSHNFPLLCGTWLAKILAIWRWKLGAVLKQYLCAAPWRNNRCKIEPILKCAVRQYSFIKPRGYAEFRQSTLLLISGCFFIESDPTAQVVQIHLIFNTESGPRYDTWKAKEKKDSFFLFSYWLLSSQKTQQCPDVFSSVCCWLCTM